MHVGHVHHHHYSQLSENLKAAEIVLNGDRAARRGSGRIAADQARVAAESAALAAWSPTDAVTSVDISA